MLKNASTDSAEGLNRARSYVANDFLVWEKALLEVIRDAGEDVDCFVQPRSSSTVNTFYVSDVAGPKLVPVLYQIQLHKLSSVTIRLTPVVHEDGGFVAVNYSCHGMDKKGFSVWDDILHQTNQKAWNGPLLSHCVMPEFFRHLKHTVCEHEKYLDFLCDHQFADNISRASDRFLIGHTREGLTPRTGTDLFRILIENLQEVGLAVFEVEQTTLDHFCARSLEEVSPDGWTKVKVQCIWSPDDRDTYICVSPETLQGTYFEELPKNYITTKAALLEYYNP